MKHSEETKQKLRNYQTGKVKSKETKKLMAAAKEGVKQTPEHTANHTESICKKTYDLIHRATGECFEGKNLAQFARDKGLAVTNLYSVVCGKRKQHKGWYLSKND